MLSVRHTIALLVAAWAPQVADPGATSRQEFPSPEAILHRHVEALRETDPTPDSGDVEIVGRSESPEMRLNWRVLIRRQPFAVREELSRPDDESWHRIVVTDLHRAWELPAALPPSIAGTPAGVASPPRGQALDFNDALAVMLRAEILRLWFDADRFLEGTPFVPERTRMGPVPVFHDDFAEQRPAYLLVSVGPLGTNLNSWFDAENGRWLGWQHGPFTDGLHRLRAGRWRDFDGRTLPSVLLESSDAGLTSMHFVDEVHTSLHHADRLFAGDPQVSAIGTREVAPLYVPPRRSGDAGSIYLGGVLVDGRGPWWAVLDTGADVICIEPDLVQQMKLPFISQSNFPGVAGYLSATRHWVSQLSLGSEAWLQLQCVSHTTGGTPEMPGGGRVGLIVGMDLLDGASPVLDFARGRLLLRGPEAKPLEEIAAGGGAEAAATGETPMVARVPLRHASDGTRWLYIDVTVGGRSVTALLDSGAPFLLRLSASGLKALGLPPGRAAWEARGGSASRVQGVGGPSLPDLLVRFDEEVVLRGTDALTGASVEVVFEHPQVFVSTLGEQSPDPSNEAAYLGTGALLPFARVGIDHGRMVLELQAGSDVRVEAAQGTGARRFVVRAKDG